MRSRTNDAPLLDSILPQMVRMETWLAFQCSWEASFLPHDVGDMLRRCAAHARRGLEPLRGLAEVATRKRLESLAPVERAMLAARHVAFHRFASRQASYRATLLGLREGFDLFLLAFDAAGGGRAPEVARHCEEWLRVRAPLIEGATEAFAWFERDGATDARFSGV